MRATLAERIDFCPDLAAFKFLPESPLEFIPGQYATLGLEDGERFIQRPYSIVSSPAEKTLELYIELVENGLFTPRLWELKPGETVYLKNRIIGNFVLQEKTGKKNHIMSSTVTGAGPCISIVRTQQRALENGAIKPQDAHQLLVLHGASRSSELGYYREEMESIAREGWLRYIPTISRPWEDENWTGETGRVEELIRKYADGKNFDYTNAIAYACGHPQMIETAKCIFSRMRFPKEQIKEEKYFAIKQPVMPKSETTVA